MTIQIQLTSSVESGLAPLARMKGLPIHEYVQGLLESLAMPSEAAPDSRADAVRDWAEHFPYRRKTPLPDEAIRRESIYRPAGNE